MRYVAQLGLAALFSFTAFSYAQTPANSPATPPATPSETQPTATDADKPPAPADTKDTKDTEN